MAKFDRAAPVSQGLSAAAVGSIHWRHPPRRLGVSRAGRPARRPLPPARGDGGPRSWAETAGAALPVALTALATALAGMSTGELQNAMYWRSQAAQDQARATGQWTLAGFKRDRALTCQAAAAQLRATAGDPPPDPFAAPAPAGADPAAAWLAGAGPPAADLPGVADEPLRRLIDGVRDRAPDPELTLLAGRVSLAAATAAVDEAERAVEGLGRAWDPTLRAAAHPAAATRPATAAQAAGFELERRRYRIEAGLNQGVGYRYEARVRVSGAASDRHQRTSRRFFYAMLAAQVGASASALALARRRRSALWAVAGGTGLAALAIAASVYLAEA